MTPPALIPCRELVELVTAYLEGVLPPDRHAQVEAHLRCCDGCVAYVEQMRVTLDVVGHLAPEDVDPRMEQSLLDAFRAWKTDA
jgi:anti-sigma factor RsiW